MISTLEVHLLQSTKDVVCELQHVKHQDHGVVEAMVLTYNADESDVFVWKDGVRMKLRNGDSNGDSAGTVVSVSVSDGILIVSAESVIIQAGLPYNIIVINLLHVQFEGKNTAGSKAYKFRCQLEI